MFGLGKKKVDQDQFERELDRLLSAYQEWSGGENPDVAPTLASRLTEFKRITPDRKDSERLHHALYDTIGNQMKAMSYLAMAMASGPSGKATHYHTGEIYLARMNRAAGVLVGHIEMLDESDPVRQLLIAYGVYEAEANLDTLTADGDRPLALNFLRVLQSCSARQQLALEEWNDAIAPQALGPLGDEVHYETAPPVMITESTAPRLLPIAERRFAIAQSIRAEFAKVNAAEMPELLASAVNAWGTAFDHYLVRCDVAARNTRALVAGTPATDADEDRLKAQEARRVDLAVAAQQAVMKRWGIDFEELLQMMFEACNELRVELGKPALSKSEWTKLYSGETGGPRPRFYA